MPRSVRPSRSTSVVAALLAAGLALTGCSTDAAPAPTASAADSLLPAAEGSTSYPLTLETSYGKTVLEERPERIAVIGGLGDQESVLALGITPVVGSDNVAYPWTAGTGLAEIETFVDPWADAFDIEAVAAAEPDLIVASTYGNLEDDFEKLSEIAPVLAVEATGDYSWDWRELVSAVGDATDLSALADEEIAATESATTDAAAAHPEYAGHTVSIIINRGQESGIEFVNVAGSPAEDLLSELGFAEHPNVDKLSSFEYGEVSLENIGLVDADALLVARHGGDGTIEDATEWLEGNALYQKLSAVQNGKVAYLDPSEETGVLDLAWAFSYPNVLSNRWTVTELTTAFEGLFD
ncbi:MAG: ABC transporter substrate-binding protein [Microbacterium sp.]|uniref:ABC transporter substrate-binding protein n=1 Tax=Microbacterium sp. TaxID=51671 RepID=UPI0039E3CE2D